MAEVTITGTIKNAIRNIPFVNDTVDLALVEVFESGDIGYLTEESSYKIDDSGNINGTGIDIIVSDDEPTRYSINLPTTLIQGQETVEILEIEDSPPTQKVEDLIYGNTAPDGGTIVISGELRNPLNNLPYANAFATITLQQLFTTQDGVYPPTSALIKVSQGLFNGEDGLIIYVPEGEPSLWSFAFPDGTIVPAKFDSSMAEVNIADVLDGDYVEWVAPSDLDPVTNLELEVTGANYDEITASWDAVTGATEYDVEYSPDGVTYTLVDTTPLLTYDITSTDYILNVDTHYVRVRATNGVINSDWAVATIDDLLLYLVAGWLATRVSGNWVDSIGSNDGVQNGTIGTVAGLFGTANRFESANNEYFGILSPTSSLSLAGIDYSVVSTIRIADTASVRSIFSPLHDFDQGTFYVQSNERLTYWTGSENQATNTLPVNAWALASLVVTTGTSIQFYTNTALDTLAYMPIAGSVSDAYIGSSDGSNAFFDGDINQLLVYKGRALTSGKVARLYNGGAGLDISTLL